MSVIKQYRNKKNLTQAQLASKLMVQPITIVRWESKKTVPTLKQAHDICNVLKVPFMKLFNDYKEEK